MEAGITPPFGRSERPAETVRRRRAGGATNSGAMAQQLRFHLFVAGTNLGCYYGAGKGSYFNGTLEEIAIFTSGLSSNAVRTLYGN